MTRSMFSKLNSEYNSRFKDEVLSKTKKEIMGSSMEVVMAEEMAAVAEMFEMGSRVRSYDQVAARRLDSLVRRLKPEQYTYDVFLLCIPWMCEPNDDGNYDLFDNGTKYDEFAWAIENAMEAGED